MSWEQLLDEKKSVQTAILQFEKQHGRPVSTPCELLVYIMHIHTYIDNDTPPPPPPTHPPRKTTPAGKDIMKPVYHRYRDIKKRISEGRGVRWPLAIGCQG